MIYLERGISGTFLSKERNEAVLTKNSGKVSMNNRIAEFF